MKQLLKRIINKHLKEVSGLLFFAENLKKIVKTTVKTGFFHVLNHIQFLRKTPEILKNILHIDENSIEQTIKGRKCGG